MNDEDELRAELARANDYRDVVVHCSAQSHPKDIKIATFRVWADGIVSLVIPQRMDRRTGKVTMRQERTRKPLAVESLVTSDRRVVNARDVTPEDRQDPKAHWHWALRCPHHQPELSLSGRADRLGPRIAGYGVSSVELAELIRPSC